MTYVRLRMVKELISNSSIPTLRTRLLLPPTPSSEVTKGITGEIAIQGLDTLDGSNSGGNKMDLFGPMGWVTLGAGFFWRVNLLPGSGPFRYNLTPQVLLASQ